MRLKIIKKTINKMLERIEMNWIDGKKKSHLLLNALETLIIMK